ncbi:MarR family winged helix-turn-helix transcriptional regulator [Thalassotalea euphylliae]|uniref:MarR family transcriptional regulator n=1 Tax=Thalassotalea euphylliae TaxID=1655234 RepID=A0A3E0U5N9_9GAMM|nr:MarR family transcriptional regulator [Thalassotalea euphylliae]REL32266.1 MarR family transcriptional regulator [Thalassotalea euphylliae]
MELSDTLFELIHSVRMNILTKVKQLDFDLTPMHLKSLKVISKIDLCTGQKLANFMGRDKAQINRLIKELVTQGLVIKKDHAQDKRSQLLVLTSSGQAIMAAFKQAEQEVFEKMLTDIPASQISAFTEIASKLKANLE